MSTNILADTTNYTKFLSDIVISNSFVPNYPKVFLSSKSDVASAFFNSVHFDNNISDIGTIANTELNTNTTNIVTISGKVNTDESNFKLIPYKEYINDKINSPQILKYDTLTDNTFVFLKTTPPIPTYFPILTENDYSQGFIMRYFCKNFQSQQIIEINQDTYNDLFQNGKY
jgi:hypothetical protein